MVVVMVVMWIWILTMMFCSLGVKRMKFISVKGMQDLSVYSSYALTHKKTRKTGFDDILHDLRIPPFFPFTLMLDSLNLGGSFSYLSFVLSSQFFFVIHFFFNSASSTIPGVSISVDPEPSPVASHFRGSHFF